jgi:hypothetical protein
MTMEKYTASQWLLIDAASQYGMDKKTYQERYTFGLKLLAGIKAGKDMESYIDEASEPALFTKAIFAIQDVLQGKPTGHTVGLDAVNSGPQLLSCLLNDSIGMRNTGIINTGVVPDGYTMIKEAMGVDVERKAVKIATVPYIYGSKEKHVEVFGEKDAIKFEEAYKAILPEADWVRKILLKAWDSKALFHEWELPNGFVAHIKCIGTSMYEFDFMGTKLNFLCDKNEPLKYSASLPANVTHSYDAFVVAEMDAVCNYNEGQVREAIDAINDHLENGSKYTNTKLANLCKLAKEFKYVSLYAMNHIKQGAMEGICEEYLVELRDELIELLNQPSFEIFTIHDQFNCSPIHVNTMRMHYNKILAKTYKSDWMLATLERLTGDEYSYNKPFNPNIYDQILESDYAINP